MVGWRNGTARARAGVALLSPPGLFYSGSPLGSRTLTLCTCTRTTHTHCWPAAGLFVIKGVGWVRDGAARREREERLTLREVGLERGDYLDVMYVT